MSLNVSFVGAFGLRWHAVHPSRVCTCVAVVHEPGAASHGSLRAQPGAVPCDCDGKGALPHAAVEPGATTPVTPAQLGAIMRTARLLRESAALTDGAP